MPLVSVVMTAYNASNTITESVKSVLDQTYNDFELIIINDGSTDNTKEIVSKIKDPRIVLIDLQNQGPSIARDIAVKKSKGKYIAILDSDDIALPDRLEKQVDYLNSHTDYVLVGSNAIIIDKNHEYIYTSALPLTWEEIKIEFPLSSFYHSSVMYTLDAYNLCGGYYSEEKLYIFEDSLLWNKMKEFGKMANIKEPLIKYRLLPDSASSSGKEARLIKKIFVQTVAENNLNESNKRILDNLRRNANPLERERNYYLYIAKKLLWNNPDPSRSRTNLGKAIKMKPFKIFPYCLIILSFLPKGILLWIYKRKKF